jgi:hypothetical protein
MPDVARVNRVFDRRNNSHLTRVGGHLCHGSKTATGSVSTDLRGQYTSACERVLALWPEGTDSAKLDSETRAMIRAAELKVFELGNWLQDHPLVTQQTATEPELRKAMLQLDADAKRIIGRRFPFYARKLADPGRDAIGYAKELLGSKAPATGFTTLWSDGLDKGLAAADIAPLSVEYLVLRPEFSPLFEKPELDVARNRLRDYGYTSPF